MTGHDPLLQEVATRLLAETGASRVTVRRPDAAGEAVLVAEACAPGVVSMGRRPVRGVVEAPTYRFLAERRQLLVQEDLTTDSVAPPPSLVERYGVLAQMLAPVCAGEVMVATISVHEQGRARRWEEADVDALRRAQAEVLATLAKEGRP